MKKITRGDPETTSPDLVAENVERLQALFPEAFTEGKIDFDLSRPNLGGPTSARRPDGSTMRPPADPAGCRACTRCARIP